MTASATGRFADGSVDETLYQSVTNRMQLTRIVIQMILFRTAFQRLQLLLNAIFQDCKVLVKGKAVSGFRNLLQPLANC